MAHAMLNGLGPSASNLSYGAWKLRTRLMQTPEGRAKIEKEIEKMRREAQKKGA